MSYILVAKPKDHKILFEWVDELTGLGDGKSLKIKVNVCFGFEKVLKSFKT